MIEIRVPIEYINKYNKEIIHRNIWGSDTYTSNSDPICMMLHHGLIQLDSENLKNYEGISFFCKVT